MLRIGAIFLLFAHQLMRASSPTLNGKLCLRISEQYTSLAHSNL